MGLGGFRPKVNKEANLESLMEDIEMGKRRRRKVRRKRERERELEEEKGHEDIIENTTGC
jgi:hypothetical protein